MKVKQPPKLVNESQIGLCIYYGLGSSPFDKINGSAQFRER